MSKRLSVPAALNIRSTELHHIFCDFPPVYQVNMFGGKLDFFRLWTMNDHYIIHISETAVGVTLCLVDRLSSSSSRRERTLLGGHFARSERKENVIYETHHTYFSNCYACANSGWRMKDSLLKFCCSPMRMAKMLCCIAIDEASCNLKRTSYPSWAVWLTDWLTDGLTTMFSTISVAILLKVQQRTMDSRDE